ncbi:MAG: hypothetical protein IPG87_19750 [Saprospiraceae bacterium]|nr:hypothetical protein [Candidatus Vicinibacter affinis]
MWFQCGETVRGDSSLWLVCLCVEVEEELNGKLQSRTWRNLRLLFTPRSKKRPFSGAGSMLVSLEQSLAEPADSIIFLFLCIRLCVPRDGTCSEGQSARGAESFARLPSKVQPNKGGVSGQVPSPRCGGQAAFGWI